MIRRRVLAAALALAACTPAPHAPADAPGLVQFDTLPWGSALEGMTWRQVEAVLDQLEPRFGKVSQGKLRVEVRAVRGPADLDAVNAYYAREMTARGLAPMPLEMRRGGWARAWGAGRLVFAVQVTPGFAGEALWPVWIVTNLAPP